MRGAQRHRRKAAASRSPRWRSPGALRDPRVTSVLIGATSVAQLEDNVGAIAGLSFSDDELAEIDSHAVEGGINLWRTSATG